MRGAIKEVFQSPENKDQTQHANIILNISQVLNTCEVIDTVPVNEETDP